MIEILKTGLYDSIQDLGRCDYQHLGVPISGAMDAFSAKLANALINNNENDAVLEFTMSGPKLKCHSDVLISITGAETRPKINGISCQLNCPLILKANDVLSFGQFESGCRGYLAVLGGFQTGVVLGSRSMCDGITKEIKLARGVHLPILNKLPKTIKRTAKVRGHLNRSSAEVLGVFKGIEFDKLSLKSQSGIFRKTFTVTSTSNRMAYQCKENFPNKLEPIITSLVLPGTVQLTPSGQLIILMRDCQTTGGYPRVLQLTEKSIDRLSQRKAGETFRFSCVL